jgi:hypothetical protein
VSRRGARRHLARHARPARVDRRAHPARAAAQ